MAENQDLQERINALAKERDELIGQRDHWFERFTYGQPLLEVKPLGPYDLPVMINLVMEVSERIHEAVKDAEAVLTELRNLAAQDEDTTTELLFERLNVMERERLTQALKTLRWHLNPNVLAEKRDPRPLLACSYICYQQWRVWIPRIAKALNRRVEELPAYAQWYESHSKLGAVFWPAATKPQLSEVGTSVAFYDEMARVGELPPPESA